MRGQKGGGRGSICGVKRGWARFDLQGQKGGEVLGLRGQKRGRYLHVELVVLLVEHQLPPLALLPGYHQVMRRNEKKKELN